MAIKEIPNIPDEFPLNPNESEPLDPNMPEPNPSDIPEPPFE